MGHIQNTYFSMPAIWIDVCAEIDNLAELKVVQYVLRHTWGYREYDSVKEIKIEEFVNGRRRRDGTRMDSGTGLSESAVKEGLARAIKHGFLVCAIDDSDKGRIKKFYGLKMQEEEVEEELSTTPEGFINSPYEGYQIPRTSKNQPLELTEGKRIRNPPPLQENIEEERDTNSEGEQRRIPQFIKDEMKYQSREMGDDEHLGSNIVQAYNLYQQAEVSSETFLQSTLLAREKARARTNIKKRNSNGGINRMPYFFVCLRQEINDTLALTRKKR
jgi:hypothetical protein